MKKLKTSKGKRSKLQLDYYEPYEWQDKVHFAAQDKKVRILILVCGRRSGKSRAAAMQCVKWYSRTLSKPRPKHLIPKFLGWVVGPSYPEMRQAWDEFLTFFPKKIRTGTARTDERTVPVQGGRFEFKSSDNPDSLQNVGLDVVWITEAFSHPDAVWDRQIRPMLFSPDREGLAIIEGKPKRGYGGWVRRLISRAYDEKTGEGDPSIRFFNVPTWENKAIDIKEIEAEREHMLEDDWLEEYGAEMLDDKGGVFENIAACTRGELLSEPEEGHRYVAGLDLAKKVDFTVFTIMDARDRRLVWYRRIGQMDWNLQEEAIMAGFKLFKPERIVMDSTGIGDYAFDRLYNKGLPVESFIFTNQSKYRLMMKLAMHMEKSTVSFPFIAELDKELRHIVSKKLPAGSVKIEGAQGYHDDFPVSLALALWHCDPVHGEEYGGIRPVRTWAPRNLNGSIPVQSGFFKRRDMLRRKKVLEEQKV